MDGPTPPHGEPSSAPEPPTDEPAREGEETSPTPGKPADEPLDGTDKTRVSEPPGSDAEPPRKQRRSNEFWLGALGIVATVLAAFVGAVATYFTGVQHDNQETLRAQTSFTQETLRTQASFTQSQRGQAYTAFLSAADKFQSFWIPALTDITNRYSSGNISHSSTPAIDDMTTSFYDLVDASARVSFFSSKEVDTAAKNMTHLAADVINYLTRLARDPENAHPSPADGPAFNGKTDQLGRAMGSTANGFICAARKDLGMAGCPGG